MKQLKKVAARQQAVIKALNLSFKLGSSGRTVPLDAQVFSLSKISTVAKRGPVNLNFFLVNWTNSQGTRCNSRVGGVGKRLLY